MLITEFITYAKAKNASAVMRYYEPDGKKLTKSGVLTIDSDERVLEMQEKPASPKSNWCCPPFYFYTKDAARRVRVGIECGCGTDAPGSFIAWLAERMPVYAMEMPGKRYDIGNLESYEAVRATYKGIIG